MSVHRLHSDTEERIVALKLRHASELDREYRYGYEAAWFHMLLTVGLVVFWWFVGWHIAAPLVHWLAS